MPAIASLRHAAPFAEDPASPADPVGTLQRTLQERLVAPSVWEVPVAPIVASRAISRTGVAIMAVGLLSGAAVALLAVA